MFYFTTGLIFSQSKARAFSSLLVLYHWFFTLAVLEELSEAK
jgi:hypothetical protein